MEKTVEVIEEELSLLLHDLQEEGLSRHDLKNYFRPITTLLPSKDKKGTRRERRKTLLKVFLTLISIGLVLTGSMTSEGLSLRTSLRFHGLALIRIGLLKLLPIWNWTELYYSRCLIRNPFYEDPELKLDDCNLCETLEEIERVEAVSQTRVIEEFIKRERPFVVTDGMEDWPIMKTDQFWFDNITELYMNQEKYRVCNLNTNLRMGETTDLARVLGKLYSPHTEQWFLHWENCQKDGAKVTRQFYRRPYFISDSLDFTGSNWVLMSSDFRGRVYKPLTVRESLGMLYQVRGSNSIRLSPRDTCRDHCPQLYLTLYEGEILVVTSLLWSLEYIPGENGDNLGIMSEVSWPSLE